MIETIGFSSERAAAIHALSQRDRNPSDPVENLLRRFIVSGADSLGSFAEGYGVDLGGHLLTDDRLGAE